MNKNLRALAAAAIIAVGAFALAAISFAAASDADAASTDYISYWVAGQQLVHHQNPYDIGTVRKMEHAVGRATSEPVLTMRNPPLAFFLVTPLGFVSAKVGLIVWRIFLIACLSISIWMLWIIHGRPNTRLHLFGYAFAPAVACIWAGQFGIFLLAGVVLFLFFHQSRPFAAGMALLLCATKPHLFLPFAAALLVWIVMRKNFRILAGFILATLASYAFSYWLDPHAWSEYARMMQVGGATNEVVPTLSAYLRLTVNRYAVWVQFVPQAVACVWAVWYFLTRRTRWKWTSQGLVLLLVGAMCTPFGWLTDETMLLPAVLAALYAAVASRRSIVPLAVMCSLALIELFVNANFLVSPYFLWTTPAWLTWYLYSPGDLSAESFPQARDLKIASAHRLS